VLTAQEEWVQVPMHWVGADEVPIMMANQIFVRYTEGQVLIAFGQAVGPYEVQVSKDTQARLKREGIPARTVAQVSVSPVRFGQMLRALNDLHGRIPGIIEQEKKHEVGTQP
jgi:hypothetical protein